MCSTGSTNERRNGLQDEQRNIIFIPLPPGLLPASGGCCDAPAKKDTPAAPNMMICFRRSGKPGADAGAAKSDGDKKEGNKKKPKRAKSRELRASILYIGCDCEKRNGLQDACMRTGCQGSPECRTKPPTCAPSEFAGGKHMAKFTPQPIKKEKDESKGKNDSGKGGGKPNGAEYDCFPLDMSALGGNQGGCCCCAGPFDN